MPAGRRLALSIIVFILVLLILSTSGIVRFYTDLLWFQEVGYPSAFWVSIISRGLLGLGFGLASFLFLYLNLRLARGALRHIDIGPKAFELPDFLTARRVSLAFLIFSLLIGFLQGLGASQYWLPAQEFLKGASFGVRDPIFGLDIGFYMFRLSFLRYLYEVASFLIVLAAIVCGAIYLVTGGVSIRGLRVNLTGQARYHLLGLVGLGFLVKAWGYRLSMYNLLYSPRGAVFGAGYTDIHALLPGLKILMGVALACGVAILAGAFLPRLVKLAFTGIAALIIASFVFGSVYPSLVQRFSVEPNELVRERPYIQRNVKFTRIAYGLDKIEERSFHPRDNLAYEDLARHRDTLNNIRLWDWRPLKQTYGQLQEIRLYYEFGEVDLDRYMTGEGYRQVALSPRELSLNQMPQMARTWINEHLKYTHGYGLVMSPVNKITEEGLPEFLIKDIPPRSTGMPSITRPEIYFGERTNQYVIVGTKSGEFDYPVADQNAYAKYSGRAGIGLSSLPRRILFALRFGTSKILFSSEITSETKILFYRNIRDRVQRIAPFLRYDADPYMVVADGRLFWIWDAYTTSSMFPYSQPLTDGINYIRNSVKVVVDAYNGDVSFYLVDEAEAVAATYKRIYPGLFKPFGAMPDSLKSHIRYPEDLFRIQANVLNAYHMEDPDVFYNKEDAWSIAREVYAGQEQEVAPYYVIMRPPGEKKLQFILMLPFTPVGKNNMISWLFAKCDPPDYGRLVLYKFPKEHLVYGPAQIEARIDQDPNISQLLTLWSQKGSRVIRGNLLVIPIENSIIYVEPLYLLAEQSELPELKRVTVAYGSRLAMDTTFERALARAFGRPIGVPGSLEAGAGRVVEVPSRPGAPGENGAVAGQSVRDLVMSALRQYGEMQDRVRRGDWAGYGAALKNLEETLKTLERATK
ncbi:MAG: UPF0182 family protein [Firmicutes bacterium]|nr:UPF0182 family protein [Bacillota bacterium]